MDADTKGGLWDFFYIFLRLIVREIKKCAIIGIRNTPCCQTNNREAQKIGKSPLFSFSKAQPSV
jgi:hypothetical protein